ncbi:hypothetical protein EI94DRAFT_1697591 [Lactarius quietus]|nr:hypothetical protein EI94DRAFT_1697591 [Lactarius quietus]
MASTATRSCTLIARHATRTTQNRLLSSSAVLLEEAPAHVGVPQALGSQWEASATLQASVEELQQSTEKVTAHVRRIEAVEKDLKTLSNSSASKDDLSRLRAETKKIYDGLHIEFLDLRTFVWGMQQDVHAIMKRDAKDAK